MSDSCDVVVIGAGHNGLVHAAYLARAGQRVTVVERNERVGGATWSEEVLPGFHHSVFSYLISLLRPEVIHELDLVRHGLRVVPLETTLNPLPGGDELFREACAQRTYANLARHSRADAEAYFEFKLRMTQVAHLAHRFQNLVADPGIAREIGSETASGRDGAAQGEQFAELAGHLRDVPGEQLVTLLQMFTMSAEEFLQQWFSFDPLIAALSTSSTIGSFVSPRCAGSAYVLLHHYMGEVDGVYRAWGFQPGGTGEFARVVERAARAAGVDFVFGDGVAELIDGADGRVVGVALESGREIRARAVSSSLDPHTSLLKLPAAGSSSERIGDAAARRLQGWRSEGCSAKVNLCLGATPTFACRPYRGAHLAGGMSIAPSVDWVERAYQEARRGQPSRQPMLDLVIPSEIDPGMAPPGAAVMSCFVQYVPYHRSGGWDDAAREQLGDAVLAVLEEHLPGIGDLVLHRQVMTPVDIERRVGIRGGNIFHGELQLSQLFLNRPVAGASAYATPLDGYYLCGSGTHPGGGISGAPGRLAAQRIVADLRQGAGS